MLDLNELRSSLKMKHESQGITKGVAMKLMQELEETRAKWRKEWGRAGKAEDALLTIQEIHSPEVSDYDGSLICSHCRNAEDISDVRYPCRTRALADKVVMNSCEACGGSGVEFYLSDWGTGETGERECTNCGGEGVIDNA